MDELITLPEAARRLGLSATRLHQFRRAGRLRFRRVGRVWAIEAAEVEAFAKLDRPKVGSKPPPP